MNYLPLRFFKNLTTLLARARPAIVGSLITWFAAVTKTHQTEVQRRHNVTLGIAVARDARTTAVVFPEDLRTQHLGIIGLSGNGKTYFIERMIRQDIQNRTGFVVFDVHGDLADSVVAYLAERATVDPDVYRRTLILEPFDPDRSFGFNPLQRTSGVSQFFQSQEFAHILRRRWQDAILSPRTEELLRNSLFTLAVNHETLPKLPDLLTDRNFRHSLIEKLPPGPIADYWITRYDPLSLKMQTVFREPLLSRVSSFLADPRIRDIVSQNRSTFSFRRAIQENLWVIINLSAGRLGETATILGSMLFSKLEIEVMALAQLPEKDRNFFAIYADELQNLAGTSFSRLIAEARKYRVAVVAGHQFWKQLDDPLKQAMLAVGSRALFRLHYHDAVELAGELAPDERPRYIRLLTNLGRGEAVVRLGRHRPEVITIPQHRPARPRTEELNKLKDASAARYTVPRNRVEIERRPPSPEIALKTEHGNQKRISDQILKYGEAPQKKGRRPPGA